jgi:hypothetical protein
MIAIFALWAIGPGKEVSYEIFKYYQFAGHRTGIGMGRFYTAGG